MSLETDKRIHYFVLIRYTDNKIDLKHQHLLFATPLDGDLKTPVLDEYRISLIVGQFLTHNFSINGDWRLYFYITGLNTASDPFEIGLAKDCLDSPYYKTIGKNRFDGDADDDFYNATADADDNDDFDATPSSVASDSDVTNDSTDAKSDAKSSQSDDLAAKTAGDGEPDDVFDNLMSDKDVRDSILKDRKNRDLNVWDPDQTRSEQRHNSH